MSWEKNLFMWSEDGWIKKKQANKLLAWSDQCVSPLVLELSFTIEEENWPFSVFVMKINPVYFHFTFHKSSKRSLQVDPRATGAKQIQITQYCIHLRHWTGAMKALLLSPLDGDNVFVTLFLTSEQGSILNIWATRG